MTEALNTTTPSVSTETTIRKLEFRSVGEIFTDDLLTNSSAAFINRSSAIKNYVS